MALSGCNLQEGVLDSIMKLLFIGKGYHFSSKTGFNCQESNSLSFSRECWWCFYSFTLDIIVLYFQVHHGGAGTTAAGLKAAVTRYANFSEHLFFVSVFFTVYMNSLLLYIIHFLLQHSVQLLLYLSLETNHSGESGYMPAEWVPHPFQLMSSHLINWLLPFVLC